MSADKLYIPLVFLFVLFSASGFGQRKFDFGVHLTPLLRYVSSGEVADNGQAGRLVPGSGTDIGVALGGTVEYSLSYHWFLRGGIDYALRRHYYEVVRRGTETTPDRTFHNRLAFTALAIPIAIVYRFGRGESNGEFLVGAGTTINQWLGDPQIDSDTYPEGRVDDPVVTGNWSVSLFAGYDRQVGRRLIAAVEPYLRYSPTKLYLTPGYATSLIMEGGLSLRLRIH
jgi:hypothetical protein